MTPNGGPLIYFAGPLFSAAEKRFNQRLAARLEEAGFRVFLPQRKIFEADVFLLVLDGRVPDEGACVELGMAHCHKQFEHPGKLLIGLRTDVRAAFLASELNPMVRVPLGYGVQDEGALLGVLEDYKVRSGSDARR